MSVTNFTIQFTYHFESMHINFHYTTVLTIHKCGTSMSAGCLWSLTHIYLTLKKNVSTLISTLIKSVLSQLSSLTASNTFCFWPLTVTVAWATSGNCVEEWFPQMIMFFTSWDETPTRDATYSSKVNDWRHEQLFFIVQYSEGPCPKLHTALQCQGWLSFPPSMGW